MSSNPSNNSESQAARLVALLHSLLANATPSANVAAPIFALPPLLNCNELAGFVAAILADPQICTGNEPGLSARRLAPHLAAHQQSLLPAILAWCERAEIVAPASNPAQPWRRPRSLISNDYTTIYARLQATATLVQG